MVLASWTLDAIVAAELPLPFPIDPAALSLDPRVLAFTASLAILTGILFGLAPALQASKPDVVPVLKNELIASATGQRGLRAFFSLRQVLVVVAGGALADRARSRRGCSCASCSTRRTSTPGSRRAACW